MSDNPAGNGNQAGSPAAAADTTLALRTVDRIAKSLETVAELRAEAAGQPTAVIEAVANSHLETISLLYQAADSGETVDLPATLAGAMVLVERRDLLSGRSELVEKMLEAYIAGRPRGAEGLPENWQSTVEAARAEVGGKTTGAFDPEFATRLARSERSEQARVSYEQSRRDNDRDNGR